MKALASFLLLSFLQGTLANSLNFNRISFFPVCKQLDPFCRTDNETNSEIVTASNDGMTAIYGDAAMGAVGFIDIRDPYHPTPLGYIGVGGETTSVSVVKDYVIVAVNTGSDFVNVSGLLHVIHIPTQSVQRTLDLEGQPDSCATSPDERFVAIAIENERDEDLQETDGGLPQIPAGFLNVLHTQSDDVMEWDLSKVEFIDLEGLVEPSDPEPEYVDINEDNICVVTFQENNGIALVDLETMEVITSFTAGSVDLEDVDTVDNGIINQNTTLSSLPREPDGVTWIGNEFLCTADEGDWKGGSRGFTIFDKSGSVVYTSGEDLERLATMLGHYPEGRADNKGNEPENVEFGVFGDDHLLFVNSERSSLVFVYDVADPSAPIFLQALPSGLEPEGSKAIPGRNLFIVASEVDSRAGKVRAGISIYMRSEAPQMYPTLVSGMNDDGFPIPFGALSGLAAAEPYNPIRRELRPQKRGLKGITRNLFGDFLQENADSADELAQQKGAILYSIEDSFFGKNRVFEIDTASYPAKITKAWRIMDSNGIFADALGNEDDVKSRLINPDMTVNIDPEGVAISHTGGFWLVHEGSGTVGDELRPVESPNLLFKLDSLANIERVIFLPEELNEMQVRFGFEGVAEDGNHVVVTFQRAWGGEQDPRIGIFNTETEEWSFVFYPLGRPESQNGGWVGLSDISSLGDGKFMVLERDNQGGEDAAIKRLFSIDLEDFSAEDGTTIEKSFFKDLISDLKSYGGAVIEKVEGLAVTKDGDIWINTDNDGVDDNSGEHLLLKIGVF